MAWYHTGRMVKYTEKPDYPVLSDYINHDKEGYAVESWSAYSRYAWARRFHMAEKYGKDKVAFGDWKEFADIVFKEYVEDRLSYNELSIIMTEFRDELWPESYDPKSITGFSTDYYLVEKLETLPKYLEAERLENQRMADEYKARFPDE